MVTMSSPLAAYPYCPNLVSLYICAFLSGFGGGNLDTAGNTMILEIWEGRDSGPYMHAMHFCFGLGAFLAPLIAGPFLVNQEGAEALSHSSAHLPAPGLNLTVRENTSLASPEDSEYLSSVSSVSSVWTISTLYPLLSSYGVLSSLPCLYYFAQDTQSHHVTGQIQTQDKANQPTNTTTNTTRLTTKMKLVIVGLLGVFFFLYVGMEVAFGTFISVFAVQSGLGFSRDQASDVSAVFWGTFAAMRGLAVLLAIIARPVLVMWSSFILCLLGSTLLSVWAGQSSLVLYIGTAVLGVGMASIFATGFLWAEQKITVSSKVSAVLIISSSLGAKLFPVMVGNLVERWPMVLHYLCLAIVCGCVLIFSLASIITSR